MKLWSRMSITFSPLHKLETWDIQTDIKNANPSLKTWSPPFMWCNTKISQPVHIFGSRGIKIWNGYSILPLATSDNWRFWAERSLKNSTTSSCSFPTRCLSCCVAQHHGDASLLSVMLVVLWGSAFVSVCQGYLWVGFESVRCTSAEDNELGIV